MDENENKLLEHAADGIQEYDNPLPGWLLAILYASIVFSVVYVGFYALAFAPDSYDAELRQEEIADRAVLQAYFNANPLVPPSTENLLAEAVDVDVLSKGAGRFAKTCASCHGEAAQGLIGPNLVDNQWLHGGKVTQIFTTVVKGVPAKGMPPWGRAIPPEEIAAVVSYIRSLQGSHPDNPKPGEGEVVEPEPMPQGR